MVAVSAGTAADMRGEIDLRETWVAKVSAVGLHGNVMLDQAGLGVIKVLRFGRECYQLRLYLPNSQIGTADFGKTLPEDLYELPRPCVGQFGGTF